MRTGLWAVPVPKDAFCCCNLAAHLAPTCLRRKPRPPLLVGVPLCLPLARGLFLPRE